MVALEVADDLESPRVGEGGFLPFRRVVVLVEEPQVSGEKAAGPVLGFDGEHGAVLTQGAGQARIVLGFRNQELGLRSRAFEDLRHAVEQRVGMSGGTADGEGGETCEKEACVHERCSGFGV